MKADSLTPAQAGRVLEDLRKGIPPSRCLELFTVGRRTEIQWLDDHLNKGEAYALLLKANYGSGKSHLLQLIREKALKANFAASLVILDAKSGVRFNRMDQIFGAILRNLEVTLEDGSSGGLVEVLDFFADSAESAKSNPTAPESRFWAEVTNNWRWDYSEKLTSPPVFIALRAWAATDSQSVRDMIVDWLTFPYSYSNRRQHLYFKLVEELRRYFRDPRRRYQFFSEDALVFRPSGYQNCWNALEDFNQMFLASGLPGMAILFDEFEDVLTNLNRINYQEAAFWNLFRFVSGDRFTGKTFYAVTPSFAQKCKVLLIEKNRWDFDYSQFDDLSTFQMSPLSESDLLDLASRIATVHQQAYDYVATADVIDSMNEAVARAAASAIQDRARLAIKLAVQTLDASIE